MPRVSPSARPMPTVMTGWIASRALVLTLFAVLVTEREVSGDYFHYLRSLSHLAHGGSWASTLPEYPLPVVAYLRGAYALSDGTQAQLNAVLVATMLVVDGLLTWHLAHHEIGDGRRPLGAWLWVLLGFLTGPLLLFRFDVATAALAASGLLLAARAPARSGVALAVGFVLKLWPATLVPALALGSRRPWRLVATTVLTASAVLAACTAAVGWDRATSPLTWQGQRGIQVESLVATPLMVARALTPEEHPITFAFGAFEIHGSGLAATRLAATVLTGAAALVVAYLLVRLLRTSRGTTDPARRRDAAGWTALATVALLVATDKTFSPQYLVWFAAPLCALVALGTRSRAVRAAVGLLVVAQLLTHAVYPWTYHALLSAHPDGGATALLVLRNIVVAVLAALTVREAHRRTSSCASTPRETTP